MENKNFQMSNTHITTHNLNTHYTNYSSIIYKISILNQQSEDTTDELEELLREIIDNNKKEFLEAEENPIKFIISKHTNTKHEDFNEIKSLTLKVKKNFGILNEFAFFLPSLQELNLNGSRIHSVTELGSSFENLIALNLSNCNLHDLTSKIFIYISIV